MLHVVWLKSQSVSMKSLMYSTFDEVYSLARDVAKVHDEVVSVFLRSNDGNWPLMAYVYPSGLIVSAEMGGEHG